ncbi:phosphate ABC transporter periplasmic phosphate-binding protein (plasmid) [Chondrocystis sp. NIES-4102]|nr:phosphate ABC transporter periplasmic phosphate-binding protein [Chondrocystis sp. NIES-4102]
MEKRNQDLQVDSGSICPYCEYDCNPIGAKICEICKTTLISKSDFIKKNNVESNRSIKGKIGNLFQRKKSKVKSQSKSTDIQLYLSSKRDDILSIIKNPLYRTKIKELKKPINFTGLLSIGLIISLLVNFLTVQKTIDNKQGINVNSPQGLFNYGGSPIFAPLVASGINKEIEKYEGLNLRYNKPINKDFSTENAITDLINGELSFAYSDRPLTDKEYQKANLRSIKLQRVPIAIDGIVIYSNKNVPLSKINQGQLAKIFSGEIVNWNQIDNRIENLPIKPVIVYKDSIPGIPLSISKYYISDNYTLALRKVISTPGAISFASASLVKNQQAVKMLSLADGNSHNYIQPWLNGELNLNAFANGLYCLTRRIYLIYRQDDSNDEKAAELLLAYLKSSEGQKMIEKAGFVSIY